LVSATLVVRLIDSVVSSAPLSSNAKSVASPDVAHDPPSGAVRVFECDARGGADERVIAGDDTRGVAVDAPRDPVPVSLRGTRIK
jgi:hypothetical protein